MREKEQQLGEEDGGNILDRKALRDMTTKCNLGSLTAYLIKKEKEKKKLLQRTILR